MYGRRFGMGTIENKLYHRNTTEAVHGYTEETPSVKPGQE